MGFTPHTAGFLVPIQMPLITHATTVQATFPWLVYHNRLKAAEFEDDGPWFLVQTNYGTAVGAVKIGTRADFDAYGTIDVPADATAGQKLPFTMTTRAIARRAEVVITYTQRTGNGKGWVVGSIGVTKQ